MNEAQTRLNKIDPKFNSMNDAKETLKMSIADIRAHYFELQRNLYSVITEAR